MPHPQKEPLRPLTTAERTELERIVRAGSERVDRAARAKALLAVADGARFTEAARGAGRRAGDAVAHLVAHFNQQGLAALETRHGGGPPVVYGPAERERILQEVRREPDREQDQTGTWSLTTLQRALRRAPDGLPTVSTSTILTTLWEAGYSWQQSRTWCHTGSGLRKRKDGSVVRTTDPDATPKKKGLTGPTASESGWACRCGRKMRQAPSRPCLSLAHPGSLRGRPSDSPTRTSAAALPSG